ncbi:ATG32 (YIL146C) [Zygosaccharomyces parabailii]|nr:ATG32 (YIL146C) [Zygosaccharomyces parabailii]CDH17431.1 probable Autophagy-related protein 32 [Zygosaccharomyces bailii ISA1307]
MADFGHSSASDAEKRSLLDPHLSVLELLEGPSEACSSKAAAQDVMQSQLKSQPQLQSQQQTGNEVFQENNSISQSWQTIHRNDQYLSVIPERSSSQITAAGILSSSDTSEEEADVGASPSASHQQLQQGQQNPLPQHGETLKQPTSLGDYNSLNIEMPFILQDNQEKRNEEDDNVTITKSLTSSNSFVMPKLSLSQRAQKFRIMVLGRPGLKFYQSIPKRYQSLFELPRSHDPAEFGQYTGILVIFQELKEMVSLLNRVCQCNPSRPIIPVCQPGQRQQVRNLLESLLKNRLISLLYPPVVANNQSDLLSMFRFLQELSQTLSDNSGTDDDDSDGEDRKFRRYSQRKKKKFLEASERTRPRKKRERRDKVHRWVLWGISLTLGVGVGYYVSHFVSSAWVSLTTGALGPVDPRSVNKGMFIFGGQEVKVGDLDMDSENPFGHAMFLFKQALKQCNWAVKHFLSRHFSCVEQFGPANCLEWPSSEDHASRVLTLGCVML